MTPPDQPRPAACHAKSRRVGFSSLYFKTHASAKMIRGVIENLDHDKYHIVVFALREQNDPPNPNARVCTIVGVPCGPDCVCALLGSSRYPERRFGVVVQTCA